MGSSSLCSKLTNGLPRVAAAASLETITNGLRHYSRGVGSSLYTHLTPLGSPNISLVPELDGWVAKGKSANIAELKRIVKELRKRRRFKQALEVSEWMGGICKLSNSDKAIQLDLIGKVRGLDSAENYFNGLDGEQRNDKTYGSLLNCYVRELKTDSSLSHMRKMKELGFASVALPYNDIMCLYTNTKKHEKIPEVLEEMKQNHVVPDNFSYRICINSYGARSDIEGMEKVLEEMESQGHLVMDWNTYSVVANIYIKANLPEKAISTLKKTENKLAGTGNADGYGHLVSLYGCLGNKQEVLRIWELQKNVCKKVINKDYIVILGSLVKLEEFEEAENVLKEWESSATNFDFRVPNVLLTKYCQKNMTEKAEALIQAMLKRGKVPIPNIFGNLAAAFEAKGEMKKAVEYMKTAFSCYPGSQGWKPQPKLVKSLLNWLGDEGQLDDVEAFVGLLCAITPMDREMYHVLIKANIRSGKEVDEILNSMKADNFEVDKETEKILKLRDRKERSDL